MLLSLFESLPVTWRLLSTSRKRREEEQVAASTSTTADVQSYLVVASKASHFVVSCVFILGEHKLGGWCSHLPEGELLEADQATEAL